MPYEIAAIHDAMPTGRARKPKADKYTEHKELIAQLPEGKVAQIAMSKPEYRAFSAGIRAAGVQVGRLVDTKYKRDHVWVQWEPLTAENAPKRRGGRRKAAVAA